MFPSRQNNNACLKVRGRNRPEQPSQQDIKVRVFINSPTTLSDGNVQSVFDLFSLQKWTASM